MGMFDRLYDNQWREWQTKSLYNTLDTLHIDDTIEIAEGATCQIEVTGSIDDVSGGENYLDAYATIRDGVLTEVPAERDEALPLRDFDDEW